MNENEEMPAPDHKAGSEFAMRKLLGEESLNEADHRALQSVAITEAILHLAEHQRIANLIAWHKYVADQGDLPDHAAELAAQIHEALGVSS